MRSENGAKDAQYTATQYLAENGTELDPIPVSSSGSSNLVPNQSGPRNGFERTATELPKDECLREALAQLVKRLTPNPTLREDLLQEALIHLWRIEARRPGQTRSWYLQSCRFHLQHYLSCGRSIDSAKRWRDQLPLAELSDDIAASGEQADSGNSIFTCVSAREIMSLLIPHLSPQEQEVLVCLAEGLGAREIGRKLNVSHTMAIRHRRKIAMLLQRLDLQSGKNTQLPHANGYHVSNGNAKTRKKATID